MEDEIDEDGEEVIDLAERISALLHGNPPGVQGAALAELVARFVAGHFNEDGREASDKVRRNVLHDFVKLVRGLVPFHVETVDEMRKQREN